jgi:hypothetical protein
VARAPDPRQAELEIDLTGAPRNDIEVVLPDLRGADSISGTVVDPEGHPVKGAWLVERMTAGPVPWAGSSTGCDDKGRFRIDGHPSSTFEIEAGDRDYRWCAVRRSDITSGTHDIVLALDGTKTFVLRVRGDTGEAIERFGFQRESSVWGMVVSASVAEHAGGEATLASDLGPFDLRAFAPGWHSEDVTNLEPKKLPEIVEVKLHRACALRGVVRVESRTTRARVKVVDSKLADLEAGSRRRAVEPPDVSADPSGRFEMTVEGTGTVRLQAYCGAELSASTRPITVKPGEDVEGIVIDFVPTGSIEGTASKSDGSPAIRLTVAATQSSKTIQSSRTDEQGRYRMPGLPPGEYTLVVTFEQGVWNLDKHDLASGPSLQSWRCSVEAGVARTVDLQLLETARCRIGLALPDPPQSKWILDVSIGRAGNGADLVERNLRGNESAEVEQIDPFQAGISVFSSVPGWPTFSLPPLSIGRGEQEITISIVTGRIEGKLAPPFADDETVEYRWHGPTMDVQSTAKTDASGRFAFECVPVGEGSLRRSGRPSLNRQAIVKDLETLQIDDL